MATHEAREIQRQRQQGLGRPIISTEFKGERVVAVSNKIFHSPKWNTFHDFLGDYAKTALGADWGRSELLKPSSERHKIVQWCDLAYTQMQRMAAGQDPEKPFSGSMTGAIAAWLHLAYDLYSLEHNAEVQSILLKRLRDRTLFSGARYELFVAAAFVRAGFDIEFENESDISTTHCEFTATCKNTGGRYSVEAKGRNPADVDKNESSPFKLGKQLNKALRKQAQYTRVVFIDVNTPDESSEIGAPQFLQRAVSKLRRFERQAPGLDPLPPAYLFLTNRPFDHSLESTSFRTSCCAEGFRIPDFKADALFPSIRAAHEATKNHADMFQLVDSLRMHSEIPSTFDGEISEFAFGDNSSRLLIGRWYRIPDKTGRESIAQLQSATVDEEQKLALGIYVFESGEQAIATCPLADSEIRAFKRHPNTFFGELQEVGGKIETPLDAFDFFHRNTRNSSKETLLMQLASAPDFERLRGLTQSELAEVYAERLAYSVDVPAWQNQKSGSTS